MELPLLVRLPVSHYCKKVEWAMAHAGQAYTARDIWFRTLIDFRDVNPENTVPVMAVPAASATGPQPPAPQDGAVLLCGSATIMGWLHECHPQAGLYPDPDVAAWEAWADDVIGPLVRRECYRTLHARPGRYTRNPMAWLIFRIARRLWLNILKHARARRFEADDAAARGPMLDRVASQLADNDTGFLFGDRPTAADFATAALLHPLMRIREPVYTKHRAWPDLRAYVARVRGPRPRWRRLRPAERAALAAMPKRATWPTGTGTAVVTTG